jgi:hypothetical protein
MAVINYEMSASEVHAAVEEALKAMFSSDGLQVDGEMKFRPIIGSDKEFYGLAVECDIVGFRPQEPQKEAQHGKQGS